jgi:zinc D-Ala-D-Ala carboxypeptidase
LPQSTPLQAITPFTPASVKLIKPALEPYYSHYNKVPLALWRWKYFDPDEVASKGDGSIKIHEETLDKAEALRKLIGKPLVVTSWYRDPAHNKKVKGSPNSMHLTGQAIDISLRHHDRHALYEAAKQVGFTGFGFYNTFLHIDTGKPRTWGKWT